MHSPNLDFILIDARMIPIGEGKFPKEIDGFPVVVGPFRFECSDEHCWTTTDMIKPGQ
jgi:hypothetical protein